MFLLAAAQATSRFSLRWLWHLGGPGLILVGLVDNSVIPTPGGMDILTVILTVRRKELWWYYGLMAVVGSLVGGYVSYRLGRKGGKEGLDKRFGGERMEKVYSKFEKGGFFTVFIPAILPPPFPTGPFLVAAGALNYPLRKFFIYLASARFIRYMGVAFLAFRYGHWITHVMRQYYKPLLWTFSILLVAGGIAGGAFLYVQYKRGKLNLGRPTRTKPRVKPAPLKRPA